MKDSRDYIAQEAAAQEAIKKEYEQHLKCNERKGRFPLPPGNGKDSFLLRTAACVKKD